MNTPGPWVQFADTNVIITKWRGPAAESLRVCEVATNTRNDEGRHNINLICAAPDLLDAAREAAEVMRNGALPSRRTAARKQLEVAIAKATGV